jgi:threonine/homoserine/homoserine lactone efflux protein
MNHDFLAALAAFAFVTSITPGPNNLMLMASGANFGFRRTLPHMLGVGIGFTVMVALVGVGLVQVFDAFPATYAALKAISVIYMLYLAWKIANAAPPRTDAAAGTPLTFLQAALFQWVNPKAWAMALTATAVYAPSRSLGAVALVALIFGAVNLPSVGSWVALGQELRRFLTRPARLRAFNLVMALLLVASLYPVLAT